MKTVSGHCESSKPISISKAAKIFSKFVSADNGASHVIKYLHRTSAALSELNHVHKEPNPSPHSHKKEKLRIEPSRVKDDDNDRAGVVDNYVRPNNVNTIRELNYNGHVKPNDEEGRKQPKDKKRKHKNVEGDNAKGHEQQKEMENKLSNGVKVENGVQEIRMKKKHEARSENRLNAQEVKMEEQKNKRKFKDVEDRSGEDRTEKRMKRKHEG